MNKLLSMELKRAAKSPILWLGVIAVIAINVYGILLNGYGFKIFTTTFLLENSDLICIILAVLIPLYLGSDFENRTINNKISAGYTRKEIYIVELIVSSICINSIRRTLGRIRIDINGYPKFMLTCSRFGNIFFRKFFCLPT